MTCAKILVVDDESLLEYMIQQRFRKQIKGGEYQFIFAINGMKAIEKVKEDCQIDMILTDLRMPEMDGLTLLERLQEINKDIEAVVVSAYGDMNNIRAAMNRGAFDFLIKPIDFQDLEATINKTLERIQKNKLKQQQLQQAQAQLQYFAFHDSVTELANRTWFMQALEHAIALQLRNQDYLYGVLFLDLDRFKMVNDSLGHSMGDRLLQMVAKVLKMCVRSTDTVARLGGDEFAVLLEDVKSIHDVVHVAQRIRASFGETCQVDNYQIHVSASIGITMSTIGYEKAEDIIRDADIAMYRAKAQKEDFYAIFDPSMQEIVAERLRLESDMRKALENNEFYNQYQPIVSLATGKIVGFEVLVRWKHPEQGLISPIKFIPVAEETMLINALGWQVFEQGCLQLQRWQEQFPELFLHLNINISAIQLKQFDFAKRCQQLFDSIGLDGTHFKLELTESCLLEDFPQQIVQLSEIKNTQIQLCIDDFGTGYSSLSRLHEFPIDTLKIDRSFIQRMVTGSGHYATVELIVALAHTLNLNVVAEGIETIEELEKLKKLNCEFGQGYLFARPLDSQAATEFIVSNLLQ